MTRNPIIQYHVSVSNILRGLSPEQSSTDPEWQGGPNKALDGIFEDDLVAGSSCSLTLEDPAPWWHVNLGQLHYLRGVAITNRQDCCSMSYNFYNGVALRFNYVQ